MARPVIVAGARTPIGKMHGSLAPQPAAALAGLAIRAALERAGVSGVQVDAVILGHVVQAGAGPNPARLGAAAGGIPMGVPATTVNKLCLSGLAAIAQAAQQIMTGQSEMVVAGGMESMSNAPYLLPRGPRRGLRYGDTPLSDALDQDALVCGFDAISMGAATDRYQARLGISREDQDAVAAESHARAAAAIKEGRLAGEIILVTVPGRKGEVTVEDDEEVRPGDHPGAARRAAADLQRERDDHRGLGVPAVRRRVRRRRHGRRPRGAAGLAVACRDRQLWHRRRPDPLLLHQPANAIRDAFRRDGTLDVRDLDLIEINEAFAGVVLASTRIGPAPDRVNVNGGAIALGHPVGMSGARLVLTLALELRRRGGGTGAAALCGGGGQGDALILRVR